MKNYSRKSDEVCCVCVFTYVAEGRERPSLPLDLEVVLLYTKVESFSLKYTGKLNHGNKYNECTKVQNPRRRRVRESITRVRECWKGTCD